MGKSASKSSRHQCLMLNERWSNLIRLEHQRNYVLRADFGLLVAVFCCSPNHGEDNDTDRMLVEPDFSARMPRGPYA